MSSIICASCHKQKNTLKNRNSKILKAMSFPLCNECIEAKREPRFVIILASRQFGLPYVSEWITNNRYVGEPIEAKELV